jgi:hypothetical protein
MTTLQQIQYEAMKCFFKDIVLLILVKLFTSKNFNVLVHGISKYSKLASMVATATKG